MDRLGTLLMVCMIIAWIIVRPGRAVYNKVTGADPETSRTVIDRAVDHIVSDISGTFVGEERVGSRTLQAIKNLASRLFGGRRSSNGSAADPETAAGPNPGGGSTAQPPAEATPDPTAEPEADQPAPGAGGGGSPGGSGTPDHDDTTPPIEAEGGGGPTGPTETGGGSGDGEFDPWAEFDTLIDTTEDDAPPHVVKATAERIWPDPPAVPELPAPPPTALPGPSVAVPGPSTALPGPSNGRSTTMTAIATQSGDGALAGAPTVDDASPELTQKIGAQFDNAMTKAQRLLDQYLGSLGRKREKIGGETTQNIAQLKQGLAIAQAAAARLARRGTVHTHVAEIVRRVDDVQLPSDSYYGSTAR